MRKLLLSLTACAAFAGPAAAQERSGVSVSLVGGAEDFYDWGMRHASQTNGMWGLRVAADVERYLQLEGAYLGSAGRIDSPIGSQEATLVGSTFELVARLTALPGATVQPHAFFGVAYRHYDVTDADFRPEMTGMNDSDDLFQIPLGVGFAYRRGALVIDARITFRATAEESLLVEEDDYGAMDTWGIQGAVGYEL